MEVADPKGSGERKKRRREKDESPMSNELQQKDRRMTAKRRRDRATTPSTEKISPCSSNESETGMHPECCNEDDSVMSGSNMKHPNKEAIELTVVEEKKAWEVEVEEFLSAAEMKERERFTAKYNYDVMNDEPLVGRYEWVPIAP